MKISHRNKRVVNKIINKIYRSLGKMMVIRGTKYTFMKIDTAFYKDGIVKLTMDQCIKECIGIYEGEIHKK